MTPSGPDAASPSGVPGASGSPAAAPAPAPAASSAAPDASATSPAAAADAAAAAGAAGATRCGSAAARCAERSSRAADDQLASAGGSGPAAAVATSSVGSTSRQQPVLSARNLRVQHSGGPARARAATSAPASSSRARAGRAGPRRARGVSVQRCTQRTPPTHTRARARQRHMACNGGRDGWPGPQVVLLPLLTCRAVPRPPAPSRPT